jgi:hypothetical protein
MRLHESRKLVTAAAATATIRESDVSATLLNDLMLGSQATSTGISAAQHAATASSTGIQMPELRQLCLDAVDFCRTLVAVAPLPVVCNNPGCGELGGVSEAAAVRYVCAGCGCRYCSAACQAAGWRSHKKACRRMAACGLRVDRR